MFNYLDSTVSLAKLLQREAVFFRRTIFIVVFYEVFDRIKKNVNSFFHYDLLVNISFNYDLFVNNYLNDFLAAVLLLLF